MARYYVNAKQQITGENEVHNENCSWFPLIHNPIYLGNFLSCHSAVQVAKAKGYNADGCEKCSLSCHNR